jgi:hypothetical protein
MSRQSLSALLLAAAVVLLVLAIATIAPANARTTSDLGYATFCTFAPWSTLTLLFFAGVAWVVRTHVKSLPE